MPFPASPAWATAEFVPDLKNTLFELAPLGVRIAGAARGRLAIKYLGLAFFETDLQRDVVKLTPNAFAIFGLPVAEAEEIPRHVFWSCYHPEDRAFAAERFASDLRRDLERDTYCERVRIIHQQSGETRIVEFIGQMFGPRGKRTHIIGMLRDVTPLGAGTTLPPSGTTA